jgi:hypothetical protein
MSSPSLKVPKPIPSRPGPRIMQSARQPGERTETPQCCSPEEYKEGQTGQTAQIVALAPALEHGSESNNEEDDCKDAETFEPHGVTPDGWHKFLLAGF